MAITYDQTKTSMNGDGLPTSPLSPAGVWQGVDAGSYRTFAAGAAYAAGVPFDEQKANYGFAYPGEMPAAISDAVTGDQPYAATLAGSPLTGTAAVTSITWTLTETQGAGTSFLWDFGDGTTKTSTSKVESHVYAVAGSYTAKVTPTYGKVRPQVTAAAPAVIS